jgi:putative PIN family toxin of toxin-antitoxin system
MITAVFDTNVILQGILSSSGPAGECIQLLSNDGFRLITSEAAILEIQAVITRPKLVQKNPQLRGLIPHLVLRNISAKAVIVDPPSIQFTVLRDPSDEVFLNLAIENTADYLVSRDLDLLHLMADSEFANAYPDLQIVSPVGFLEALRAA